MCAEDIVGRCPVSRSDADGMAASIEMLEVAGKACTVVEARAVLESHIAEQLPEVVWLQIHAPAAAASGFERRREGSGCTYAAATGPRRWS